MNNHSDQPPPAYPGRRSASHSALARLGRLTRKELSEILRDRRTIVTLVVMPLLLYPLMSVAFQQFFLASGLGLQKKVEYQIGFVAEKDVAVFMGRLLQGERILLRRTQTASDREEKSPPWPDAQATQGDYESLERALRSRKIDVIVRRVPGFGTMPPPLTPAPGDDTLADFEVLYLATSAAGQGALGYIEQRLAVANEVDLLRLSKAGMPVPVPLVRMRTSALAEAGGGSIMSLASLVPLVLILMTITGAVYPAIDLTAGERERGTLEILVAAPVPRLGLLFAKYVSVVTVAVLTALVNLVAMTATLLLSGLSALFPEQAFSFVTIVQLFGLLLLFAAFFSAVLLCITSFARSFKEAQAYLIPLMLVSLAPGVMGMMPGLKLADWAWAPLLNIVLLGRDLFEGGAELGPALVVITATMTYALAAIAWAARIFGAESVLYNEQSNWGDLFRRQASSAPVASLNAVLWCLALMIPLNFVLKGLATLAVQGGVLDEGSTIFLGPPYALILFVGLPALFAWRERVDMKSAFAMVPARWPAYLGAILLGLALWPILFGALAHLDFQPDESTRSRYEQIVANYRKLPTSLRVLLVVVPALLEEWFFRGYVYSALRRRAGATATVAVTTLLFGVTHFVLNMLLGFVRVLPSAAMGLPLGLVREASGSVWPGMLLHAAYNGSIIMLLQDSSDQEMTVEPWWVLAGVGGSLLGAALVWWGRKTKAIRDEAASD